MSTGENMKKDSEYARNDTKGMGDGCWIGEDSASPRIA